MANDDESHRADPFGRSRLPDDFSREHRLRLVDEVARALVSGEVPSRPAALLVGGALLSWMQQGGTLGALERDFLKVAAPHRSTLTPQRLWQRMQEAECSTPRATSDEEADTMHGIDNDADSPP
jgi:hypothetical protein